MRVRMCLNTSVVVFVFVLVFVFVFAFVFAVVLACTLRANVVGPKVHMHCRFDSCCVLDFLVYFKCILKCKRRRRCTAEV